MNNMQRFPYLNIFLGIIILSSISCSSKSNPDDDLVITSDSGDVNANMMQVKAPTSEKVVSPAAKTVVLNTKNAETVAADNTKEVFNQLLQRLQADIKAKDAKIAELQNQLKPQQNSNLEKQLKYDLVTKEARIAQLQNQLKSQQNQNPDKQSQSDLRAKDEKIAQLQNQLKSQQNQKQDNKHSDNYDQLVKENKYLNFDVRSVIKSNLVLTKEYDALKKTNQDLNNQIRELKKSH